MPSPSLGRDVDATVLLPTSYTQSDARYPVLYLLHGRPQDHTAFAVRPWFAQQTTQEMIIVTPNVADSWYINSVTEPANKYEDFMVRDLVSYVDEQYRTVASREGRAVAGISMGGWGAMMLGLKHHQLFRAVGAFGSPFTISRNYGSHDMTDPAQQRFGEPGSPARLGHDVNSLAASISLDSVPLLFIGCGSRDIFCTTIASSPNA